MTELSVKKLKNSEDVTCLGRCVPIADLSVAFKGFDSDMQWRRLELRIDQKYTLKHLEYREKQKMHFFEVVEDGQPKLRFSGVYSEPFDTLKITQVICCCGQRGSGAASK
jgi:hypothetical protein